MKEAEGKQKMCTEWKENTRGGRGRIEDETDDRGWRREEEEEEERDGWRRMIEKIGWRKNNLATSGLWSITWSIVAIGALDGSERSLASCPPLQAGWPHWSANWSVLSGSVCRSADGLIRDWLVGLVALFNHCDRINEHEEERNIRETNTFQLNRHRVTDQKPHLSELLVL